MITRVSIENLVIVERAEFEPGTGLTSITGETGAGKTLLATAIGLLFGSEAKAGHVGPYGDHTFVEGEFEVSDAFWQNPAVAALNELRPDDSNVVVLARRVDANGRTRALAWGRTVSKVDLAAAGQLLIAIAGQHAQRRLLESTYQRQLLDDSGNAKHVALVAEMSRAWDSLQSATASFEQLRLDAVSIAAREEEIRLSLEHIDSVDPSIEDEEQLIANRDVVRNKAALVEAMSRGLREIEEAATDSAGKAYSSIVSIADIDADSQLFANRLLAVQEELTDISAELRSRLEDVSADATSVDDLEERLSAYDDLKRRYGGTTAAVCAHRERLRQQSELLVDTDAALAASQHILEVAQQAANAIATTVSKSRKVLAQKMQVAVMEQLADLSMADSRFEVQIEATDLSATGSDRITFAIAPNAKLDLQPIASVASGGEMSRIALALLVATGATEADTIFFDEIDAGIGGHTAHAIANQLEKLAQHVQVVCITHLAQVAAKASSHVVIEKTKGETSLRTLNGDDDVISELCRMMGADISDKAALDHARNLRKGRFAKKTKTAQMSLTDG